MLRTTIALALALAAVAAQAQTQPQAQTQAIFKCIDPAGKVEYRNSKCPSGTTGATVDMQVATGKILEIQRSTDQRREIETKTVPEQPAPPVRAPLPSEPVNALPPPPAETKR